MVSRFLMVLGASAAATIVLSAAAQAQPAQAQPARGSTLFRAQCAACHSVAPAGGGFGAGPNLRGVVGRDVAGAPGFAYSPALKKVTGAWDEKRLDTFLTAPGKLAPGTMMMIAVPNPTDRGDLIAYLASTK